MPTWWIQSISDALLKVHYAGVNAANQALKQFSIESQSEYEEHLIGVLKTSPKQFHAYLHHKKIGCPSVGPLWLADGSLSDDPGVMA